MNLCEEKKAEVRGGGSFQKQFLTKRSHLKNSGKEEITDGYQLSHSVCMMHMTEENHFGPHLGQDKIILNVLYMN